MARLRHSDPSAPGIRRIRHGRGFRFLTPDGSTADAKDVTRAKSLAIPPVWTDVWVCPWPNGHIQATGFDDAGRRQYLYHEQWRRDRDGLKHDHVLEFAAALPAMRRRVSEAMATRGLNRDRVLGAGIRLLDLGLFRVGGDQHRSSHRTFGLATLERRHVTLHDGRAEFRFQAKGGIEREVSISDPETVAVLRSLLHRKDAGKRLLAYYDSRQWPRISVTRVHPIAWATVRRRVRPTGSGMPKCRTDSPR